MIHFFVPPKPTIEDFGLDTKAFLAEKAKNEKRKKTDKVLSSIPWTSVLLWIVLLLVCFFYWRSIDFQGSVLKGILAFVLCVIIGGFIEGFLVYGLSFPIWLWKFFTQKYPPSLSTFVHDWMDDIDEFIFESLSSIGQRFKDEPTKAYSDYCEALSKYESAINHLRYKYPMIDECKWDEACLTKRLVGKLLPEAIKASKEEVELINNRSEQRWWSQLEPKQFEYEVSEWFKQQGFTAEVTKYVGDGGVDIIVEKDGQKGYVQCKHFLEDKVPVAVVRELRGVMASDGVSKGYIVCLNGLSSGEAYAFANRNNITVIDLDGLIQGERRVPIQENNGSGVYSVGPFSILKDVFSSKEEAISRFASNSSLSISVLRINDLYMVVLSKSHAVLHSYYNGTQGRVAVEYTKIGSH